MKDYKLKQRNLLFSNFFKVSKHNLDGEKRKGKQEESCWYV